MVLGEDHVKFKCDRNKASQTGEKCTDKHACGNPTNPLCCPFLALGIWFYLESQRLKFTTALFQNGNTEEKSSGNRYTEGLRKIFKSHMSEVEQCVRKKHANAHGMRKGSATHASLGTTQSPSIASIAQRGEWSLGLILDLCIHFAEPGDFYLGGVLAGLDPNDVRCGMLPPHFDTGEGDPMEDEDLKDAMHLMCRDLLKKCRGNDAASDPTGMLVLFLASIVFHSDWLADWNVSPVGDERKGHTFSLTPLFSHPDLLDRLKEKVTLERRGTVIKATGMPPH